MDKWFKNVFKPEPLVNELKAINLLTNSLTSSFLNSSMRSYHKKLQYADEEIMQILLKVLKQKGTVGKRIKVLVFWIEVSKISKYNLANILMDKKIKTFTEAVDNLKIQNQLNKKNMESFLLVQILIPLYDFLMKLSVNDELYRNCVLGKIPEDDLYRRGTKIRFIWIFKVYNLINSLLPILQSLLKALKKWPDLISLVEIARWIYQDILLMNNFIIKALEQASSDNFFLMPYLDTMQLYESITQQIRKYVQIQILFNNLHKILSSNKENQIKPLQKPKKLSLSPDTILEIENQAMKIKLIRKSLKKPKIQFIHLQTEYEEKVKKEQNKIKTNIQQIKQIQQSFDDPDAEEVINIDSVY